MIEQTMYFSLGFLIAALLLLSLLPLLRRRAERLARRRFESRVPLSLAQIDAQHSLVLARCAMRERSIEQKLESISASRAQVLAEAGRRLFQLQELEERLDASARRIGSLEDELAAGARGLAETETGLKATLSELEALKLEKNALAREFEVVCARLAVFETRHEAEPDAGALAGTRLESGAESGVSPALVGGWDAWADQAALEPLPRGDAFAYLRRRARGRDESGAAELLDVLGSTPLTLELAAAYCRRTQTPFSVYAVNARLLMSAAPGRQGRPASLAAAFGLSVDAARKLSATAERLVAFMGLCASSRAPLLLLESVSADPAESRSAARVLTDLALASRAQFEDGAPALHMRQAIHDLARERAEQTAGGEAVDERILSRLVEIYPPDAFGNPASRSLCAQLTPHLVAVCARREFRAELNEARADLQVRAGDYLLAARDFAGAEPLFQSALSIRAALFGESHPETAASLDNLASLRCAQGDFAGASELLERARTIFETSFGLDYPATGRRQTTSAKLLLRLGRAREALTLAEGALARLKANGLPRHPWTIEAAFVVADALEALGKRKKAAALRNEFSGAPAASEPVRAGAALADHLLEHIHGLAFGWGKGFAPRNPH